MIENIRKRDGRLVAFDNDKIAGAVYKALQACNPKSEIKQAYHITQLVEARLEELETTLPTVELVQDVVEEILIEEGLVAVAKAYILYRDQRKRARNIKATIIHSLESQNGDEVNLFEALDNLMHETRLRTRQEDIFTTVAILEDLEIPFDMIKEQIRKFYALTPAEMEKYF